VVSRRESGHFDKNRDDVVGVASRSLSRIVDRKDADPWHADRRRRDARRRLSIHRGIRATGAYLAGTIPPVFRQIAPPRVQELEALVARMAERIGRSLEREGLLARDCESSFLTFDPATGGPMDDLLGHSITYRVAVGPRTGQKAFTLQTVPGREEEPRSGVAQYAGFSLHAGIGIEAEQREKLERLARYVSRPAVSVERLALTGQGDVRYRLKTPYRDGTTHIVLEPLDFLARLAALVPPPRVHLTRYHGVFAPNAALRAAITPARRGQGASGPSVAIAGRHV
jgi:hypothetical protein